MYSALLASLLALEASAYTWPDLKYDAIEEIYVGALGNVIPPCDNTIPTGQPGVQTAADWLRTAYHDMATADVVAGTGGIDASIIFETNRSENVGDGFAYTFQFFSGFQSPDVSMSDIIALGAVVAVQGCGAAVKIPFRYGRVDAAAAGPLGVPEPFQDLATHTSIFKRQGFNQTEMIGLVACGHTIGGVHGEDFPDITAHISTTENTAGKTVHFDHTFDNYDNNIATSFVSNTSSDPLLIGPDATNSDHRIFNSDGGSVMKSFANSNDLYLQTCQNLLERMINTVPKSVQLSDPIEPIPVKPEQILLNWNEDGSMQFSGMIRITGTDRTIQVTLNIANRDGSAGPVAPATFDSVRGGLVNTTLYSFNQTIQVDKGISSFTVGLKELNDSKVIDNGGYGFPVSDDVVFQTQISCVGSEKRNLILSVRDGAHLKNISTTWFEENSIPDSVQGLLNSFKSNSAPAILDARIGATGYTIYSSISTFTVPPTANSPRAPDFFGGTYDVTAQNAQGSLIRIVGPALFNLPDCQTTPKTAPNAVQNSKSAGSNKLIGAVEGNPSPATPSGSTNYAPILLGLLVGVAILLIVLIGMVITLLVRNGNGEHGRRMPPPAFRPLGRAEKFTEVHDETESLEYQTSSGKYSDEH